MGGPSAGLPERQGNPRTLDLDAGAHLEARHLLLQREAELPAHHHQPQQVRQALSGRPRSIQLEVRGVYDKEGTGKCIQWTKLYKQVCLRGKRYCNYGQIDDVSREGRRGRCFI